MRRGAYTTTPAAATHPVTAAHGMVVAQEKLAARIGRDVLAKGGNAVDAAVATGFAMAVTYPRAGNIGGGGFMLIHLADGNKDISIDYRETTSEALAATGATFDIVLNMEVVEHVANVPLYMKSCADLVAPGGLLFSATINRTARALAFAKFAAEYVLRWLPAGTHDWSKFLTPDELEALITRNGLRMADRTGVVFHPLADEWRKSPDMGINYMLLAERPSASRVSSNP
ncbi:MAG: 3-demethylubiquinone-9 3-O-methyltransferase [Rhizobiales bacterium]|nr:3-demethylubiquinone-9 3-O-methyltransferase [Hyphomicrobiales bacterium]